MTMLIRTKHRGCCTVVVQRPLCFVRYALDWRGLICRAPQRSEISEPTTFSLSALDPRVTATAPERTSSITP